MVKINLCRLLHQLFPIRNYLNVVIILCFSAGLQSQGPVHDRTGGKKIEVLHSDSLVNDENIVKEALRLLGHVKMKDPDNDAIMTCDSAYYYQKKNQFKAFSKIHIQQGDTLTLNGDYLFYEGAGEIANMDGNVELIDKETHLLTNSVKYDFINKIASYNDRGRIINGKNTLTSLIGIYNVSNKMFHFRDSVKIVNPDYVMKADSMDYNTESETAFFTGPSELKGDSIYIYCEKGWYDTKKDIASLWQNAVIDNRLQIVHGDSINYDKQAGYGEAFRNISIADTTNNIIINGNYAWYRKDPEKFMVTDKAMFIQISDKDSLFLHADTINAITVSDTSGKPYKLMKAFHGCRIYSPDLQSRCDSLSYSFQDSVIKLYHSPIIWSEENQLTSDSIAIFTKNRQADSLKAYNSAFVAIQVDSVSFNQIKGRSLTGYFRNNKMYKINVAGNSETIYFVQDDNTTIGVSHDKSASIEILIDNGKTTDIYEYQSPEGVLDPPKKNSPSTLRLDGFKWFDQIRPKKKSDIFIK